VAAGERFAPSIEKIEGALFIVRCGDRAFHWQKSRFTPDKDTNLWLEDVFGRASTATLGFALHVDQPNADSASAKPEHTRLDAKLDTIVFQDTLGNEGVQPIGYYKVWSPTPPAIFGRVSRPSCAHSDCGRGAIDDE
jgi:hypothetical protein